LNAVGSVPAAVVSVVPVPVGDDEPADTKVVLADNVVIPPEQTEAGVAVAADITGTVATIMVTVLVEIHPLSGSVAVMVYMYVPRAVGVIVKGTVPSPVSLFVSATGFVIPLPVSWFTVRVKVVKLLKVGV
jgi:hypothetical protein